MFFIGVIIDSFAFFLESKESNESGDRQKDQKNDEATKTNNETNKEHPATRCN